MYLTGRKKKMIDIIIVDDEKSIREGIAVSIPWEKYDINICGVASGVSEALDLIENICQI